VTTILAFVILLGIIIFVHEMGHLLAAKAFGMRVFVFSFGFGKRLAGFKWGDTDCRLSAIPLGGYVKLEGEADDLVSEDTTALGDGKDFTLRPRWQRFVVYLAGPVMNAVLAMVILAGFYRVGFAVDGARYDRPIVGAVEPGSPAAKAEIRPGDEILAIDGERYTDWEGLLIHVALRPGRDLRLRLLAEGAEREVLVKTATDERSVGTIGVYPLVRIGEVLAGKPAAEAGLRVDDAILAIAGQSIQRFDQIPGVLKSRGMQPSVFRVLRDRAFLELLVSPRDEGAGPKVGIAPKRVIKKFALLAAIGQAGLWVADQTTQTFRVVGGLITMQVSPRTLEGPLRIAQASGDAARDGTSSYLYVIALISLQVGIFNLFPLAPLDGGHMAIILAEGTIRRDFSLAVKNVIMNAGFAVIMLLIVFVFYSDLSKTRWLGKLLP
jgi:regulator of sigma E protease